MLLLPWSLFLQDVFLTLFNTTSARWEDTEREEGESGKEKREEKDAASVIHCSEYKLQLSETATKWY